MQSSSCRRHTHENRSGSGHSRRRKGIAFTEFHASNWGVNGPLRLQTTTAQPHRHLEEGGGRRGFRTERGSSRERLQDHLFLSPPLIRLLVVFFQLMFFFSAWVKRASLGFHLVVSFSRHRSFIVSLPCQVREQGGVTGTAWLLGEHLPVSILLPGLVSFLVLTRHYSRCHHDYPPHNRGSCS